VRSIGGTTNVEPMTGMPLAILDDSAGRGDPWRRPTFVRGTEQPELERGENLLVRIADCVILLETRGTAEQSWLPVWRSSRWPGQATVTDRRVVVGCRRYDRGGTGPLGPVFTALARAAGYRPPGRCLGGHLRYEWVREVSIALGQPGHASHLMLTVDAPWLACEVHALPHAGTAGGWPPDGRSRQWRLVVGSVPATAYLPDLVALVANEVAQAHRRGAGPDADLGEYAELAAAQGWPELRPPPGGTGTVHIPGACPLGTRPVVADDRAWRA
jgi:hypothetical protein